jgi:hypothetical protein
VAAKSANARSQVATAQALEENERLMADRLDDADREGAETLRQRAGRSFRLEGEAWIDVGHSKDKRLSEVKPFSQAYFDLLERLPELRAYWRDSDRILVSGAEVSIGLDEGGATRLSNSELARIVKQFRG